MAKLKKSKLYKLQKKTVADSERVLLAVAQKPDGRRNWIVSDQDIAEEDQREEDGDIGEEEDEMADFIVDEEEVDEPTRTRLAWFRD
ncbi:hypothetical protein L1987_13545 [Smallanthus sonchifolius]|uniref:Uncharacterized protein n=1 Tax=Smallanthus sonchifolius TaxID=185202 RepID=A0ACB9JH81_9ASTR|nr:hypothetical protein L1987_13545 [Smallanthus sonchifolius]